MSTPHVTVILTWLCLLVLSSGTSSPEAGPMAAAYWYVYLAKLCMSNKLEYNLITVWVELWWIKLQGFYEYLNFLPAKPSASSSSCCSHLVHTESVKRFVSLQYLNLWQSVGLLERGISPSQGHYSTWTQNKYKRHIHVLGGIRTHDPSVRAGEEISCLRPHGHCDRPSLT
jgi:hypothetical protein